MSKLEQTDIFRLFAILTHHVDHSMLRARDNRRVVVTTTIVARAYSSNRNATALYGKHKTLRSYTKEPALEKRCGLSCSGKRTSGSPADAMRTNSPTTATFW